MSQELNEILASLEGSLAIDGHTVKVVDEPKFRRLVGKLVETSALGTGAAQGWSRYVVRCAALDMDIFPASIHELYMARGRGELPLTFTVPAINLRVLSFDAARAVFRALLKINASALIFEIARSEIGYTAQRPAEYATNILAAAIAEGYRGPIFIQGDHFQVSGKRYASEPETELEAVRTLTREAVEAGFYNIDIDTSTLVDINQPTVPAQQKLNYELSAMYTALIRSIEPQGIHISVGGEIGEVGGHNSTEEELRAYMDGYNAEIKKLIPGAPGLSKISIQTGTSHGGVVLPDGSIAKVSVDFDTLRSLSRVARKDYCMGGTVQHGASTLPEDAFGKFVESEACEVHLATNFQNMFFENAPAALRQEMYAWLDVNAAGERKPDMTPEQFYYKSRKSSIGPFKAKMYALPAAARQSIGAAWEAQFDKLFGYLSLKGTRPLVEKFVHPVAVQPSVKAYLGDAAGDEDVSDLAD